MRELSGAAPSDRLQVNVEPFVANSELLYLLYSESANQVLRTEYVQIDNLGEVDYKNSVWSPEITRASTARLALRGT